MARLRERPNTKARWIVGGRQPNEAVSTERERELVLTEEVATACMAVPNLVAWSLAIRLGVVSEIVEFPMGAANPDASLAEVDTSPYKRIGEEDG